MAVGVGSLRREVHLGALRPLGATVAAHLPFWSFLIVAVEKSGDYVEAAAVTVVAATVLQWVALFLGTGSVALWSGGRQVRRPIGRRHWPRPTP